MEPIKKEECTADSFDVEGASCMGELMPIMEEVEQCTSESFNEEGESCMGELVEVDEEETGCEEFDLESACNSFKIATVLTLVFNLSTIKYYEGVL